MRTTRRDFLGFAPSAGPATGYRRWLAIDEAAAGVTWQAGGDTWTREIFSSAIGEAHIQSATLNGDRRRTGPVGQALPPANTVSPQHPQTW